MKLVNFSLSLFVVACGTFGDVISDADNHYQKVKFGQPTSVNVPAVFIVDLPADLSKSFVPSMISISTTSRFDASSRINFVAIHGHNSETWMLSPNSTRSRPLCISSNKNSSIIIVATVDGDTLPLIESHRALREVTILVDISEKELLPNQESISTLVTETAPLTLVVNHSVDPNARRGDNFVLYVESADNRTDDVCVVVAVQNRECPFTNRADNYETAAMYATMLKDATFTISSRKFHFIEPFYVNIIVLPDDLKCNFRLPPGDYDKSIVMSSSHHMSSVTERQKFLKIRIEKAPAYSSYLTPIIVTLLAIAALILVGFGVILGITSNEKRAYPAQEGQEPQPEQEETGNGAVDTIDARNEADPRLCQNMQSRDLATCVGEVSVQFCQGSDPEADDSRVEFMHTDDIDGIPSLKSDDVAFGLSENCRKVIDSRPTERRTRIKKGLNRLRKGAKLKDMSAILSNDVWYRRNRSRVYLYIIPIVCLFYFVPAIQFAALAKQNEDNLGSQDLCFHNFRCAKPLSVFSDFNHIISNLAYMVFGVAFIGLVYLRSKRLPKIHNPKLDHLTNTGILQQLSIFYAMGFALMFQGFFSICYHICPTNLSLQFDTTMMYLICLLCYIKIYQFRHPDATPNAYSVFMFLGVLVLLEAMALYWTSWIVFILFILFYIFMTVFVAFDCYYIGIGRLDTKVARVLAKDIISNWGPVLRQKGKCTISCIRYPMRFIFASAFLIVNFCYAISIIRSKYVNTNKTVTHTVLFILAGNMMLYLLYYVVRRNGYVRRKCHATHSEPQYSTETLCYGHKLPLSAGTFFAFLAALLGIIALVFYFDRSANRNLSPAGSRNLNTDCILFDFYDGHDIWHFLSAAGIFMAFLSLLTIDDDLMDVSRSDIDVF